MAEQRHPVRRISRPRSPEETPAPPGEPAKPPSVKCRVFECQRPALPGPGAPTTTASLHREMVEALRKAKAALDEIAAKDIDWSKGTGDNVNLLQAMAEEALYGVVAALEGWEKRPRLRQDDGVLLTLAKLVVAPGFTVEDAADALDALLFGERG